MAHNHTRDFEAECKADNKRAQLTGELPLIDALAAFADFCDAVADDQDKAEREGK